MMEMMEDAPSSSRSRVFTEEEAPLIVPAPHQNPNCPICNSFRPRRSGFLYDNYFWDKVVASARNCACCDAIVRGCRGWLNTIGETDIVITKLQLWFNYDHFGERGQKKSEGDEEDEDLNRIEGNKEIVITFSNQHSHNNKELKVQMYAATDEAGNKLVPQEWKHFTACRRTTGSTGSTEAFKIMNYWLTECVTDHEACGSDSDRLLPTRLLDLGSFDGDIRLVEIGGKYGRYAALSHCWGSTQPCTTTKETLPVRKEGIPHVQLTKTFQEAAKVCRELHIRYLWIDSLCILQGDRDDWAREASRMATVYQNALITIAATASDSGDKGLFREQHEYEIQGYSNDGKIYHFVFRGNFHPLNEKEEKEVFPLRSRAWVLQERLLSPRVLHFTRDELLFECLDEGRCECRGTYKLQDRVRAPKSLVHLHRNHELSTDLQQRAPSWRCLVDNYSKLRLKFSSDKLVAVEALARKFAQSNNRYLAGLWSNTLIEDLQWHVSVLTCHRQPRPSWRAPSWSWASVNGGVSYYKLRVGTPCVKVLACDIASKGTSEYGEIQSGKLRLRGRCAPVTWLRAPAYMNAYPGPITDFVCFLDESELPFDLDFQPNEEFVGIQTGEDEIVCLLLSLQSGKDSWQTFLNSLVLRRLEPGVNVFERIGLLEVVKPPGLEDVAGLYPMEETIVEIV